MSRVCDLTGKRYMSGNNVSHANNRTRRKFNVNLRSVILESESLKEKFRLKIAASTMRTISKNGGFDKFIIKSSDTKLSETGLKIKRKIISQVKIDIPTFKKNNIPNYLKKIPVTSPGSRRIKWQNLVST